MIDDWQRFHRVSHLSDCQGAGCDCVGVVVAIDALRELLSSKVSHLKFIGSLVELDAEVFRVLHYLCDVLGFDLREHFGECSGCGLEQEALEGHLIVSFELLRDGSHVTFGAHIRVSSVALLVCNIESDLVVSSGQCLVLPRLLERLGWIVSAGLEVSCRFRFWGRLLSSCNWAAGLACSSS